MTDEIHHAQNTEQLSTKHTVAIHKNKKDRGLCISSVESMWMWHAVRFACVRVSVWAWACACACARACAYVGGRWVMAHVWMSHVTHVNEARKITHFQKVSNRIRKWCNRIRELCPNKRTMSHIRQSHVERAQYKPRSLVQIQRHLVQTQICFMVLWFDDLPSHEGRSSKIIESERSEANLLHGPLIYLLQGGVES